jgi:hypothetical protein
MGFGDRFAQFNLSPGTADALDAQYGAPTPEELQKYGANPAEVAAAQRFNAPATAAPAAAATNPLAIDPKWDPAAEQKRTRELEGEKERAKANPNGPAGDDGFPTYRDLNNGSGQGAAAGLAPAGPVRTVPAHWQPGTRSESRQHGMNPDELVDGQYHRDVSAGQSMLAGDKQLQAAQQAGMADAVYAAAHTSASQNAAAKMAHIQAQRDQYVQTEQAKLASLSMAAQERVDPEAAKGGPGAQLMATIAVALGQFGASLTGGPNTALQMVNANIDRNIAAQQTNIANAGKAHDREASLYRQNMEVFGDKERATLATKMQYLDQVKGMADQQYALAKNTANEGQYHAFIAGVEEHRAKAADDFAKLTHTQLATQGNEHYVPTAQVGGGAGGLKGQGALYVPSLKGYARDEATAKRLNLAGEQVMSINEDLHTVHSLLKEAKGLSSITDYGRMQEIRQEIDARKAEVLRKSTVLRGQGAMSDGDKLVSEQAAGLANVDPQLKTEAQIDRAMKGISKVAEAHQRDHRLAAENNIRFGEEQYRQGPNGPEPVARLAGQNKVVSKKTESVSDLIEKPKGKSER